MDAVRIDLRGERRVVVDDEQRRRAAHARAQRERLRASQRGIGGLVAILDRRRAAGERGGTRAARSAVSPMSGVTA